MQRCLQIGTAIALALAVSACTSQPTTTTTANGATISGTGRVCLNTLHIKKQGVLSDQDIKFEMNNGDVWVNHLPRACTGLRSQGGFAWDVHNATVCSNQEIIHVLNDGPSCSIGEFTKQAPKT